MREYCLVSPGGKVVNMCMTGKPEGPLAPTDPDYKDYVWVPVRKVPTAALQNYRYWNERP